MTKQIETATMEGIGKKGLRKTLGDTVEEYFNIMRIKNKHVMARNPQEWRNIYLELRSITYCSS
jgi:hypothetical protein